MPVLQIKSVPQCKLCSHPERPAIDSLLEKRSLRQTDEEGNSVNVDYCIAAFKVWGVVNPTLDNIKVHWRKHCQLVEPGVLEAEEDAVAEACRQLAAEYGTDFDVERYPDLLVKLDALAKLIQLSKGELPKVTADQALKAIDTKQKTKHNEKQNTLLDLTAQGLTKALELYEPSGELPPGDDTAVEVEDAEYTEE